MRIVTKTIVLTFKWILITICWLALVGCGIPGIQRSTINIEMSSLNEVKSGQLIHGCFIKADRNSRSFEQTVRYAKNDTGHRIQFSYAHLSIDRDTDQVVLSIDCEAGFPHMLKSTSREYNVFEWIGFTARIDIEQRFDSNVERDRYLQDLIRTGFSVDASAWDTVNMDVEQKPPGDARFKSSLLGGHVTAPYQLLGIWSQFSPNCSGGSFFPREATFVVRPQNPDTVNSYKYIDPTLHSLRKEAIYIPEWKIVGTIRGWRC